MARHYVATHAYASIRLQAWLRVLLAKRVAAACLHHRHEDILHAAPFPQYTPRGHTVRVVASADLEPDPAVSLMLPPPGEPDTKSAQVGASWSSSCAALGAPKYPGVGFCPSFLPARPVVAFHHDSSAHGEVFAPSAVGSVIGLVVWYLLRVDAITLFGTLPCMKHMTSMEAPLVASLGGLLAALMDAAFSVAMIAAVSPSARVMSPCNLERDPAAKVERALLVVGEAFVNPDAKLNDNPAPFGTEASSSLGDPFGAPSRTPTLAGSTLECSATLGRTLTRAEAAERNKIPPAPSRLPVVDGALVIGLGTILTDEEAAERNKDICHSDPLLPAGNSPGMSPGTTQAPSFGASVVGAALTRAEAAEKNKVITFSAPSPELDRALALSSGTVLTDAEAAERNKVVTPPLSTDADGASLCAPCCTAGFAFGAPCPPNIASGFSHAKVPLRTDPGWDTPPSAVATPDVDWGPHVHLHRVEG